MCALAVKGGYWEKHIYFYLHSLKYENTFCFIYNVQTNLLNYEIKQNM